ncbi:hypothetical protein [Algivirga pacifica]|uniref:Uncharacterized protein n=1 Tax=Algivirga pacifica TaxID=1162670 RepID=A0ABP9D8W6_9BACT
MFDLDSELLSYRSLPPKLREKLIAFVRVLITPLVALKALLISFRNTTTYKLSWGRSKISVETLLRQEFDDDEIYITTVLVNYDEFLLSPSSYKSMTPRLGSSYLRTSGEGVSLEQAQLTVQIPSYLSSQEDKLKAILQDYLHAGFIYEIQYV